MTYIILLILILVSPVVFARDLTPDFLHHYEQGTGLSLKEKERLKNVEVILVPGILAEALIKEDQSAPWDFSLITEDYFKNQLDHFDHMGLMVSRLSTSSFTVKKTVENIRRAVMNAKKEKHKIIFITHSLGGLAMLDFLFSSPNLDPDILGIVFLQSPFYGTSIASVYLKSPYEFNVWLRPILPFLNVSKETIEYLSVEGRTRIMKGYEKRLAELNRSLPVMTMGGNANRHLSVFEPGLNMMEFGCFVATNRICLSKKVYNGKLDSGDGLVPLQSTYLPNVDSVVLDGVDHGEIILDNLPFQDYDSGKMSEVLLKMLMKKI